MKRNMKQWVADMIASPRKKALPLLLAPATQLLGITIRELVFSAEYQSLGMKMVADCTKSAAAVGLMDLSVEAEAFGSVVQFSEDALPAAVGIVVTNPKEAERLQIPAVGTGRTGIYIDAICRAGTYITDRPAFASATGPYSLTGQLIGVNKALNLCHEDLDMVNAVMEKATTFLVGYINAFKMAGANGVVLADPLTGMLASELAREVSLPYVRKLVHAVQDDQFIVIYHNCGNNVLRMADAIVDCGAAAYHFGNAIDLKDMLPHISADCLVLGNVDPAGQICNGTPASIKVATHGVMAACSDAANFCISSGCDIPPHTPWENIDAFFDAAENFWDTKNEERGV